MTNITFKNTIAATLAVATLATASMTTTANAGSKDFWRGAAAGAVAGVVTGAIINNNRRDREVVYVERHRPRTVIVEREVIHTDGHAYSDEQHVRWCLNRFNSYNPNTDQYLSFSGYYKYCNSPYSG